MSKYVINDTTLTAIGDAVRSKSGTSDLIPVSGLADAITNLPSGGGGEVEPIVLSGDCLRACSGPIASQYMKLYGNTISTKNVTNCSNMFTNNTVERIPFDINISSSNCGLNSMFYGCANLTYIPDIDCKHTNYADMSYLFGYCKKLKTLPKIINAHPGNLNNLFSDCHNLREIPEDYFDTWDFTRLNTYTYSSVGNMFIYCYSLRKLPAKLFEYYAPTVNIAYYNCIYYSLFGSCYVLDEAVDLPVYGTYTSNMFSSAFYNLYRVNRITFKTDNGVPKNANWSNVRIDLNTYVGYGEADRSRILGFNSGITADKEVTDDATYQALKNDPDWFTRDSKYSRYNHDSAVETINSLPDTSGYGTNTIQFAGKAGSATDGGAINTLTDAEIAVAASKGWTVTFA